MSYYQLFLLTLKAPIAIASSQTSPRAHHAKILKVAYHEDLELSDRREKKAPTIHIRVLSILPIKSTDESQFKPLTEPVDAEVRRDNILASQRLGTVDAETESRLIEQNKSKSRY